MSAALSDVIQPDERLRPLLTRDYLRFRQPAEDGAAWLAPPSAAVTVTIDMGEAFGGLPRAFVAGPAARRRGPGDPEGNLWRFGTYRP